MPNLSCPECGPHGGLGRVTLAISVVDCSLCDGTAPRGIAKHVKADLRTDYYARMHRIVIDAVADIEQAHSAPLDRDSWAGHDDLRDEHMRAVMLDAMEEHARRHIDEEGLLRWTLSGEHVSAGTPAQFRAHLSAKSTPYIADRVLRNLPAGTYARDAAKEVLS